MISSILYHFLHHFRWAWLLLFIFRCATTQCLVFLLFLSPLWLVEDDRRFGCAVGPSIVCTVKKIIPQKSCFLLLNFFLSQLHTSSTSGWNTHTIVSATNFLFNIFICFFTKKKNSPPPLRIVIHAKLKKKKKINNSTAQELSPSLSSNLSELTKKLKKNEIENYFWLCKIRPLVSLLTFHFFNFLFRRTGTSGFRFFLYFLLLPPPPRFRKYPEVGRVMPLNRDFSPAPLPRVSVNNVRR